VIFALKIDMVVEYFLTFLFLVGHPWKFANDVEKIDGTPWPPGEIVEDISLIESWWWKEILTSNRRLLKGF